jgi:hypothetical protein
VKIRVKTIWGKSFRGEREYFREINKKIILDIHKFTNLCGLPSVSDTNFYYSTNLLGFEIVPKITQNFRVSNLGWGH